MAPLAPVTPRITLLPRDDSEGSIKGMLVSVFREVKKVCAWVLMSFGAQSFPRKRESTPQTLGNVL